MSPAGTTGNSRKPSYGIDHMVTGTTMQGPPQQFEMSPTIKAGSPNFVVCTQYGDDAAGTLICRHDSSPCPDRGQNVVCYGFSAGQSKDAGSVAFGREVAPTLRGGSSGTNQVPTVVQQAFRIGSFAQYRATDVGNTCRAAGGDLAGGSETLVISRAPNGESVMLHG